jgi:hypothetical protein
MQFSAKLLDSESQEPIANATITAFTFTLGEVTGDGVTTIENQPSTENAGTVMITLRSEKLGGCGFPPFIRDHLPEYPDPDQVEIIVLRDGCEQRFMIEVNQDTVVDLSFPNRMLELKDPILVPPCEEPANSE